MRSTLADAGRREVSMRASERATAEKIGLTVADVAARLRVGEDKVRTWISRGELRAINTAEHLCGKPRWVVTPEALAEFERRRTGGPPPKPPKRRRRTDTTDYYPDGGEA
jgi:excisionase family DNA binding protein